MSGDPLDELRELAFVQDDVAWAVTEIKWLRTQLSLALSMIPADSYGRYRGRLAVLREHSDSARKEAGTDGG